MTIRPPRRISPRRAPADLRDRVVIGALSALLVVFWLRVVLASLSIDEWTAPARIVRLLTMPVIRPLRRTGLLDRHLAGQLLLAELLAALLVTVLALFVLSTLANRRR
jgi:hypothetical protein